MDKALIKLAADRLDPEAVFLRAAHIRCKKGFTPPFLDSQVSLVPQYRGGPTGAFHLATVTNGDMEETRQVALFYFRAGLRLVDTESVSESESEGSVPEDAVHLEIECEYCAQYGVDGTADEEALRPALNEFARFNVGYHVWPFWREYVQSTCARIGIPPVPVPMYRIPPSGPESDLPRE